MNILSLILTSFFFSSL